MKIKLEIPSSLKDIKLSQHQKFIDMVKDSEDVEYINLCLVSCFCNLTPESVRQISRTDFDNLVGILTNILNERPTIKTIINVNSKEYGLLFLEEMTVGEQADLDALYNDYSKRQKVMSILYRPITVKRKGKYLLEPYTGKEEPLDLTMDIVKGADVFFYNILSDCMNIIQNYIQEEEVQHKLNKTLAKNGIGIKTSMPLVEEAFLNLKQQLN